MSVRSTSAIAWFPFLHEKPGARLRLVCVPYAAGSARIYRDWPNCLPAEVEVCAVQPPGRENRMIEPCFDSATEFATALADRLQALPSLPTVLFGHSMGALIAFETTRELERRGIGPIGLIVSAASAPHLAGRDVPLSHLDDDTLIARLREVGGTPDEILGNTDLMRLCLPKIRADFALCENYRQTVGEDAVVRAPLYALGATDDSEVQPGGIEAWRLHAGTAFRTALIDGDHFIIDRRPREFLVWINHFVRECLLYREAPATTGTPRKEAWTTAS